jgi:lipoprotein NlpI
VPFPLEWIFYGIIILGLVAGVPTAYLLFHHSKTASSETATTAAPGETPSAAAPPANATPPASAEPPPNAAAPPATTPPATAVAPTVPTTNAAPAPVPPPSSPAEDAARQASAFVSDGTLKYQHGDFDGAISAFNQALTLDPKSSAAFFSRGIAKAAHDDLDGAVADYSQALDLDPNMAQAYYYRGLARHSKEELDGAISDYNSAVRIDPKNALAFFNRGLIRMQKDDIDGAIVDSTQALELDPKLIQSYYDRGLGRLAKGAADGALEDMKAFTQFAPQDGYTDYARLYIWLIETQKGQLAEANKELELAMNTSWNGKSDDMVTRIGEFLLGQISESDLIKASGSSMPSKDQGQRCEAWYFIGMRKLEAGDKDGAAEALRKCVDTQKTDYCEFILAQEELKKLMPGSPPEPATLPAPRAQAAGLPDPGTMAPPDSSLPPIPH